MQRGDQMNNGGANFIERLLATFRIEADEHLQVISDGLIELERPSGATTEIIETIFREAHSLKGAARAVNMTDIEVICQSLESVFAAMKRKHLGPTPEMFDVLHQANDTIRNLLSDHPDSSAPAMVPVLVQNLLDLEASAINRVSDFESTIDEQSDLDAVDFPPLAAPIEILEAIEDLEEGLSSTNGSGAAVPTPANRERSRSSDTVRISAARLSSLLLQAEEMVSAKLSMKQIGTDLSSLNMTLEAWNKQWGKIYPEVRNVRHILEARAKRGEKSQYDQSVGRLLEFMDWNREQIRDLESRTIELASAVDLDSRSLGAMVDNLLEDMKKVLMLPFSSLLDGFPKLIRDLSREQGKDIDLVVAGGEIEIDRRILEELKDPLIHIIRNCVDHGMEKPEQREQRRKPRRATATIAVSQTAGNTVEIIISDDGCGIDPSKVKQAAIRNGLITEEDATRLEDKEAISLIFQSEVSTSAIITDLSGRGLGLAIVREKVEKLGGDVSVDTVIGGGTTFRITVPLTLATFRGILMEAADRVFVIPTGNVERVMRIRKSEVTTVEEKETIRSDEGVISLVRLEQVLDLPAVQTSEEASDFIPALILGSGEKRIAFGVDAVLGEQEVLVKSLGKNLTRVRNIAGATVLGSGKVVPILSAGDLLKSAVRAHSTPRRPVVEKNGVKARKSVLVAEDSITSRMLLKNILEAAGYSVKTAVDGIDAFTTLRSEDFDLVVSDVEMPGMSGLDLTSKIRGDKKLSQIPVVLVTSLGSREDRERGIDVGANAYIVKSSFDQSNLLEVIRRLV